MMGDWNCIVENIDATHYPAAKISPSLKRLVNTFGMKDDFRTVNGDQRIFSRYYTKQASTDGATRLDRVYSSKMFPVRAKYLPAAISDHMLHEVVYKLIDPMDLLQVPKRKIPFKISPQVIENIDFQNEIRKEMIVWNEICEKFNHYILDWWESLVKPQIRIIAIEFTRKLNKSASGRLNVLYLKQAYYCKKLREGDVSAAVHYKAANNLIVKWFEEQAKNVQTQLNLCDITESETTNLYHHSLHKKKLIHSAILELDTEEGSKRGHIQCAEYILKSVENLLQSPFKFDSNCQSLLLNEVNIVFTEADNKELLRVPSIEEVRQVISTANQRAVPGNDGIIGLLYATLFNLLGSALHEVIVEIFCRERPTLSQRTCMMIFAGKPGKLNSKLLKDKRKISLLNFDFKILTGIENSRHSKILHRTVSSNQYALGENKRIHHAVSAARDALYISAGDQKGSAICDLDFKSALDFLCMDWVYAVLKAKGMNPIVIERLSRYYRDSSTIPIINNVMCGKIENVRLTLRQGDCPSSVWFGYGIDPLLNYLERRLSGMTLYNTPVLGPAERGAPRRLKPVSSKYILAGYCDDLKPAITKIEEFKILEKAVNMYEKASGCILHRDLASNKCKILLMGAWTKWSQDEIPLNFLTKSDHLDMLGIRLFSSYQKTRVECGAAATGLVKKTMDGWKVGKRMPLTDRTKSINIYLLSKLWYKFGAVDVKKGDCEKMLSAIKT